MCFQLRHLSRVFRKRMNSNSSVALNGISTSTNVSRTYVAISKTDSVYKNVFGDWKGYTFEEATPRDFEKVSENIINNFLPREKINSFLPFEEASITDHKDLVRIALSHRASLMVIDSSSNVVVGVNLVMDSHQPGFINFTPKSKSLQTVFSLIEDLEKMTLDALHTQFKTDHYAEIFMTSILKNHKGRGILHELYTRQLVLLKAQGFQTAKGAFTSPATEAVARRLGFQELGRIVYRDYKDPSGVQVFPKAKDDSFAAEMAIAL